MSESKTLLQSIADPDRLCPVFSAAAHVRGRTLKMRLGDEIISISAPAIYLSRLFDWCQGEKSLTELTQLSKRTFGTGRFMTFVQDLLNAGVLIDAAQYLPQRVLDLDSYGRRAAEVVCSRLVDTLANEDLISASSIQLDQPHDTALGNILSRRQSATSFCSKSISRSALENILFAAYAHTSSGHRTVASAGAYYQLEVFLVLLKPVETIGPALYRVVFSKTGAMYLMQMQGELDDVPRLLNDPAVMRNATGLIFIGADFRAAALKYRNRAYSYMMIEAGAAMQNMALMAAELTFGWRTVGLESLSAAARFLHMPAHGVQAIISGVFGAASSQDDVHHAPDQSVRMVTDAAYGLEFSWVESQHHFPFHMGMARIMATTDATPVPFSWGRDRHSGLAYDKAVAEATERYAYRQLGECHEARFGDFANMCEPAALCTYLPAQYEQKNFPFSPFDIGEKYLWRKAKDLLSGQEWWVPAECVYARSAIPEPYFGRLLTSATSSGCASGVSEHQAQESALFELVERDAFMRHWFAQRGGDEVDIQSLPDTFRNRANALVKQACEVKLQLLDLGVFPVWFFFIRNDLRHFTVVSAAAGVDVARSLEACLAEAETGVYARMRNQRSLQISPAAINTPADHGDLYAQKRYFNRADALSQCQRKLRYEAIHKKFPTDMAQVLMYLRERNLKPLWIDFSLQDAPRVLDGRHLISGRILIPGLIPIAFGRQRQPLGMDDYRYPAARFPHPFP